MDKLEQCPDMVRLQLGLTLWGLWRIWFKHSLNEIGIKIVIFWKASSYIYGLVWNIKGDLAECLTLRKKKPELRNKYKFTQTSQSHINSQLGGKKSELLEDEKITSLLTLIHLITDTFLISWQRKRCKKSQNSEFIPYNFDLFLRKVRIARCKVQIVR